MDILRVRPDHQEDSASTALSSVKQQVITKAVPLSSERQVLRLLSRHHALSVPAVPLSGEKARNRTYECQDAIKRKENYLKQENNDQTTTTAAVSPTRESPNLISTDVVDKLVRAVSGKFNDLNFDIWRRTAQSAISRRHPDVAYIIAGQKCPEEIKFNNEDGSRQVNHRP